MKPQISTVCSTSSANVPNIDENRSDSLRSETLPIASVNSRQIPFTSDRNTDRLTAAPSVFASDISELEGSKIDKKTSLGKYINKEKKFGRKSSRYNDKTKAKVHLGACGIGGIIMLLFAGPVSLVFAASYINTMCLKMYGGGEVFNRRKKAR